MTTFDLPYFDQIIERLEARPDSSLARAFERHVHWGDFDDPGSADGSLEGYLAAAEALTERICRAAGVADGQRILDVGCGFGGTVDLLDRRLTGCELVGLNIDPRQLARARELVTGGGGNSVTFVEGDACDLPFEDGGFDAVLAVECIFHFPSRKRFFREARRMLRPGGALALSDFVLRSGALEEYAAWARSAEVAEQAFYGDNGIPVTAQSYARLAHGSGFTLVADDDITERTLPTYPAMRRLYEEADLPAGVAATDYLEQVARRGYVGYHVLSLRAR